MPILPSRMKDELLCPPNIFVLQMLPFPCWSISHTCRRSCDEHAATVICAEWLRQFRQYKNSPSKCDHQNWCYTHWYLNWISFWVNSMELLLEDVVLPLYAVHSGGGGSQNIWTGVCRSSLETCTHFKGHFGRKRYPIWGDFLEKFLGAPMVKTWKFLKFWKNGPLFRDIFVESGIHAEAFLVKKQPIKSGASPYVVIFENFPRVFSLNFWWGGLKIFGPHRSPMGTKSDGGGDWWKKSDWSQNFPLNAKLGHFLLSMKYSFLRYFWA